MIPVIIGALGTIHETFEKGLEDFEIIEQVETV